MISKDACAQFLRGEIAPRAEHLSEIPSSFSKEVVNIVVGLGAGLIAIGSLGLHQPTANFAFKKFSALNRVVAMPYVHLLYVINPRQVGSSVPNTIVRVTGEDATDQRCGTVSDGRLAIFNAAAAYLDKSAEQYKKWWLVSRLNYALIALVCLVSRAIEGIIGIPAIVLAILTVGKFRLINDFAVKAFHAGCDMRSFLRYVNVFESCACSKK